MLNPLTGHKLKPGSARLCLSLEKLLRKNFCPNQTFILALSGGADSTALAVIMKILGFRQNFKLSAIHINHQIRDEADNDARFVEQLCRTLDIPACMKSVNVPELCQIWKTGLEDAGRKARIAILEQFAAHSGASAVLTGHHAGDLGEDVLMRLARGSAWPALAGMKIRAGIFFRPLLHTPPQTLREFLINEGIEWREDQSNKDLKFTRNRFRRQLLPLFMRENPSFLMQTIKLNDLGMIDSLYWQNIIAETLANFPWQESETEHERQIFLASELLKQCQKALRLRLYAHAINNLAHKSNLNANPQIRTENLLKADDAWEKKNRQKIFQLPGEISLAIVKSGVRISLSSAKRNSLPV